MNLTEPKYSKWALCREMLAAPDVVRRFNGAIARDVAEATRKKGGLLVVGEGSSLLFPGRRAMTVAATLGVKERVLAAGCREAARFDLARWAVLAFSASGKSAEVVELLDRLKRGNHDATFCVTNVEGSPVTELAHRAHVLPFEKEEAFAATRSVLAEALFIDHVIEHLSPGGFTLARLSPLPPGVGQRGHSSEWIDGQSFLGDLLEGTLSKAVTPPNFDQLLAARIIYFAGDAQIAGELALKCNEIARKPAVALEGSLIDHGPRKAAITSADVVVPVGPFADPAGYQPYLILVKGWSMLVELGLRLNVDLDGRDLHV